ncbi:hypothetical protein [Paracoccus sp. S3-43]|uniref:DedA family protein n=1 Tax=Paracoccus sp. S3-43 TaxID=3030011 RepID=UPI0023B0CCEA|nr:hypothetical protein [Paracoccus sp. S3-43]WEF23294.1 hypothetical protein PXD02_10715 [Paracoccus sp. S3-43]
MTQALAALLPHWGPLVLAVSAFLSCMMVPLPTSALLLTAGALSGTGHLWLPELVAGRFAAASLAGECLWAVLHLTLGHLMARGLRHSEGAALKAVAVGLVLAAVLLALRTLWRRRDGGTI